MATDLSAEAQARRCRLLKELAGRSLDQAYFDTQIRADMEAEASSTEPHPIITPQMLEALRSLIVRKQLAATAPVSPHGAFVPPAATGAGVGRFDTPALFFSTDAVVIVPGFLASALADTVPGGYGLIWISLLDVVRDRLGELQLAPYNGLENDLDAAVRIAATGELHPFYDLLRLELEFARYTTEVFPVDWRKDLDWSAGWLVARLRTLGAGTRPVHLIAHSQGALVARRALQLLGTAEARRIVHHLVLLGPANFGTFSAAFAIAGDHSLVPVLRSIFVEPPHGFQQVLSSMSGCYQLLPWNPALLPSLGQPAGDLRQDAFWQGKVPIDLARFHKFLGWAGEIDTTFFNDRTIVILGDNHGQPTIDGVTFNGDKLVSSNTTLAGDGTVPHVCSILPGAPHQIIPNPEHMMLPTEQAVIDAVKNALDGP